MKLPAMNVIANQRMLTEVFQGLDTRPRAGAGAFGDMENMQSEPQPLIATRKRRGWIRHLTSPHVMMAAGKIAYIDGDTLYWNEKATPITGLSEAPDMLPKQIIAMGAYLIVWPDGKYYNTVDPADFGSINRLYQSGVSEIRYDLTDMNGVAYDENKITVGNTAPPDPKNNDYWIDTNENTHQLKQWKENYGMWMGIGSVYVKITAPGIGKDLNIQDSVKLSGIRYDGYEETIKEQFNILNTDMIIQARADDYIVVTGIIDKSYIQTGSEIRADREAPKMDFVIECNNRLWGCYHGVSRDQTLNEIYASALGDFKNWRKYVATSQASYSVSMGTEGDFTAAISFQGRPYFFKENAVHKIYGEMPKNYQLQTTICDGVRKGCENSLIAVNGTLYYLSINGVVAFETLPMDVSPQLPQTRFDEAAAGEMDGKYYISMRDADGEWQIYVLNTAIGVWHKEDRKRITHFARIVDELYMLEDTGDIWAVNGTRGEIEEKLPYSLTSAMIGYEYPDRKYLSRYNIRMKLGKFATCDLWVEYDSSGIWEKRGHMEGHGKVLTYMIPVIPRRCDHMRIKLTGEGEMQLYSIARLLGMGGDGK